MKNTLSIFVSIVIIILVACLNASPVFAETTSTYWEPITNIQDSLGCVNGIATGEIYTENAKEFGAIKITYNPYEDKGGIVTGWEFPLLEEGKNYEVLSQNKNAITIKLINDTNEIPYINALVDFEKESFAAVNVKEETTELNIQPETVNDSEIAPDEIAIGKEKTAQQSGVDKTIVISIAAGAVCVAAVIIITSISKSNKKQ